MSAMLHQYASRIGATTGIWTPAAIIFSVLTLLALGFQPQPPASAASSQYVPITATVSTNLSIGNTCSSAVNLGGIQLGGTTYSPNCAIDFGEAGGSQTKITVADSNAAPFLSGPGSIANTSADCGALGNDESGIHILGATSGAAIMNTWATSCTTPATEDANERFRPVPANGSPADACSTTDADANNRCTFEWAVNEVGSDLTAGSYSGTAVFTAVIF